MRTRGPEGRERGVAAALALALAVSCAPCPGRAAAPGQSPLDLHGPDGLPFTPDDPLIVTGGYTNSALFATMTACKQDGTGQPEASFQVGSWKPGSGPSDKGLVELNEIFKGAVGGAATGTAGWKVEPREGLPKDDFYYFDAAKFAKETPPIPASAPWWDGGKNVRPSFYRFHLFEWDGKFVNPDGEPNAGDDPAARIDSYRLRNFEPQFKTFEIAKMRTDIGVLAMTNLATGKSGITVRGFCRIEGVKIILDGTYHVVTDKEVPIIGKIHVDTMAKLKGIVTNKNRKVHYKVNIADVLKLPMPEIWIEGDYELDQAEAIEGMNRARDKIDEAAQKEGLELPPLGHLTPAEEAEVKQAFQQEKGVDFMANSMMQASLRTGRWLPWLATDDPLFKAGKDLDLTGTKLDPSVGTHETMTSVVKAQPDLTNGGMTYLNQEGLLYGRHSNPSLCRFIEWYGAQWLCVDASLFNPAGNPDGQGAVAAGWQLKDLVVDRELTPAAIPVPWPPGKCWNGGQGAVLFGEAGTGCDDTATVSDTDPQQPGSPVRGLMALFALSTEPRPDQPTRTACNVFAFNVGHQEVDNIPWAEDPSNQLIEWPPPNTTDPAAPIKWLFASVANGNDRAVSSGQFQVDWDFDADGKLDCSYGNASWPVPAGTRRALLLVRDTKTGRTGCHLVDFASP